MKPKIFIFGYGSTVVQNINVVSKDGGYIHGIGLINTETPHDVGSIPDEETQKQLGIFDNSITIEDLDTIMWFRTLEHRDKVYQSILNGQIND